MFCRTVFIQLFVCITAARPFFVNVASHAAVSAIAEFREDSVDISDARKIAGKLVGDFIDGAHLDELISDALNTLANGADLTEDTALDLTQKYAEALSDFAHDPDYPAYTSYFRAQIGKFRVDDAFNQGMAFLSENSNAVQEAYKTIQGDERVQSVVSTVTSAVNRFANDLGVGNYASSAENYVLSFPTGHGALI